MGEDEHIYTSCCEGPRCVTSLRTSLQASVQAYSIGQQQQQQQEEEKETVHLNPSICLTLSPTLRVIWAIVILKKNKQIQAIQAIRTVNSHRIVLNRRQNTVISRALHFSSNSVVQLAVHNDTLLHIKSKCSTARANAY
jgi:hypothetical protein